LTAISSSSVSPSGGAGNSAEPPPQTAALLRQRSSSRDADELVWQTVAQLAAEGSYQKNDLMNEHTAQQLAEDLLNCEIPHTSPSGKATYRETSWSEFERHFEA